MKLNILQRNFLQALENSIRFTTKSINFPILEKILLQTEKNFLKVTATDLEISLEYWVLAQIEKKGSFIIPGKLVFYLLQTILEEKLQLEVKGNTLFLKGKNFQIKILGQEIGDFPIIPKIERKLGQIDSQALGKALSDVVDFCSLSQIRPELAGVFLKFESNQITLAASDSFRLTEQKILLKEEKPEFEGQTLILPQRSARELIHLLLPDQGNVDLFISPNQLMVEKENEQLKHLQFRFVAQLIEGSFPDYKSVVPQNFQTEFESSREEFLQALKTVSLFSGKGNEVVIKVIPQQKQVELFAQNPDLGENKILVSAKIKGKEITSTVNHKFLTEGFSKIKMPRFSLKFSSLEGPILLKSALEDTFFYLVMPIKSA